MGGGATYARRAAVAPDLTLSRETCEQMSVHGWSLHFLTRATTDADVVGSFHPMVLHPPSHDKLELARGVKVVSPRDGRDVVRGRTEAFHRVER